MFEEILKNLLPERGRVLEAGCGSGSLLRKLAAEFPEVHFVGIDPFVQETRGENLEILRLRAEEVDKLPGWFHLIFSHHSLHHFSSPVEFLRKAGKKLAVGGKILVWDWDEGARTGIPERYFSREELRRMTEEAGLRVMRLENFGEENLLLAGADKFRLAVASDDGLEVFPRMFGRAGYFFVYEVKNGSPVFMEKRTNIHRDNFQHLKTYDVYRLVDDCNTIITGNIGKKGEARLSSLGVRIIKFKGKVEEALKNLIKELQ